MNKFDNVINEIKLLTKKQGFIYSFLWLLYDGFYVYLDELENINPHDNIGIKEASLLLGFLVQSEINYIIPNSIEQVIGIRNEIVTKLSEIHKLWLYSHPMFDINSNLNANKELPHEELMKEFFNSGMSLSEQIFYAGCGVYDFQYLEYLEKKYKYDKEWLIKNKHFNVDTVISLANKIKQEQIKKAEKLDSLLFVDSENKDKSIDGNFELNFLKFAVLTNNSSELNFEHACKGLLEFFAIHIDLFNSDELHIINLFTQIPSCNNNNAFQTIGDFNNINQFPIIQLDTEIKLTPVSFLLFEAVYETPYYWMLDEDKQYFNQSSNHRGVVGEEISFDLLSQVFGNKTFKSIKIQESKSKIATDIDVLCILGTKALCVQVKTQKLTLIARKGDEKALLKDFTHAVQDAFEQCKSSSKYLLQEKSSKFINSDGTDFILPNHIDEVFMMVVTTENYPALTNQAYTMLKKDNSDNYPLALSIFDLELLTHYLSCPYEFLYYMRQRINFIDKFRAETEITYLGYHLTNKIDAFDAMDLVMLDNQFAALIDKNYHMHKLCVSIPDTDDPIKNKWCDSDFEQLCNDIKSFSSENNAEVIFYLYDWDGKARTDLVKMLRETKTKTQSDKKDHSFTLLGGFENKMGVSYLSINSDSKDLILNQLASFVTLRKYNSKASIWLGLGSVYNSTSMVDIAILIKGKWQFDNVLEKHAKELLNRGQVKRINKIGRNEPCNCGSRIKYKKCCGRNL